MSGNLLKAPYSEIMATLEALAFQGVTREDFTRIRTDKSLAVQIADLIHRPAIINCSADPFCPDGWTVEQHDRSLGQLELDVSKILLHLSANQKGGGVKGKELCKELKLKDKPVLNANVLDWLLNHQELIPDEWKKEGFIFFWGTIYRDSGGRLGVRSLWWGVSGLYWDFRWLGYGWSSNCPAAVLASS